MHVWSPLWIKCLYNYGYNITKLCLIFVLSAWHKTSKSFKIPTKIELSIIPQEEMKSHLCIYANEIDEETANEQSYKETDH